MWPTFRPADRVRVRRSGRVGDVNAIDPNERGDAWVFEILFERGDATYYEADELELVQASGQEHDPEIELALDVSVADAEVVADEVQRLIGDTFEVERVQRLDADHLRIGITPRAHPRPAVRALMERLGSPGWLVEDDGWYANVTWARERFPLTGVDGATIFLRPWRDPRDGERLPGEPID